MQDELADFGPSINNSSLLVALKTKPYTCTYCARQWSLWTYLDYNIEALGGNSFFYSGLT